MDHATFQREMAFWLLTQGIVILGFVFAIVKGVYSREEDRLLAKMKLMNQDLLRSHNSDESSHTPLIAKWERDRNMQLDRLISNTADIITSRIERVVGGMLTSHNNDPHAHGPASDHNHAPIMLAISGIQTSVDAMGKVMGTFERSIDKLVTEHEMITGGPGRHPCAPKGDVNALKITG